MTPKEWVQGFKEEFKKRPMFRTAILFIVMVFIIPFSSEEPATKVTFILICLLFSVICIQSVRIDSVREDLEVLEDARKDKDGQ